VKSSATLQKALEFALYPKTFNGARRMLRLQPCNVPFELISGPLSWSNAKSFSFALMNGMGLLKQELSVGGRSVITSIVSSEKLKAKNVIEQNSKQNKVYKLLIFFGFRISTGVEFV
jgi:hypothetical protein